VGEDACDFSLSSLQIVEDRRPSQDSDDGSDYKSVKGDEWLKDGHGVDVWAV
jgi:hypothetical protein